MIFYDTNFWGDAGNNYGFGSSNISSAISAHPAMNTTPTPLQTVQTQIPQAQTSTSWSDGYSRGIDNYQQAQMRGSFMSGVNSGYGGYTGNNGITGTTGSSFGSGSSFGTNSSFGTTSGLQTQTPTPWSTSATPRYSGYNSSLNNSQGLGVDNYAGYNTYSQPPSDVWAQQRKRAVENDLLMNGMDVLYGMNRTVNGMTFGGLDWLGNKLGFDSQMNDYLQLKDAQSRNLAQTAGQIAGYGGSALTGGALANAGYNQANMAYNGYKIGKAYDKLTADPFQGNGSDIIARMRNHNGEPVVLQRGEAIPDKNKNIVVSGEDLRRATGTKRNYGLDKIIHKHNMPRDEVVRIPRYLKQNQPVEVSPRGQNVYAIQQSNGEIRLVTTPKNGENIVSSMYYLDR